MAKASSKSSSQSPAAAARARNTAAAAASWNAGAIATAAKANASAAAQWKGNASLTPTQQYAAMTPTQKASFSKNNSTVDTWNLWPALNFQNQQWQFESVQWTWQYQRASTSTPTEWISWEWPTGNGPWPVPLDMSGWAEAWATAQWAGQDISKIVESSWKVWGAAWKWATAWANALVWAGGAWHGSWEGWYQWFNQAQMQNILSTQQQLTSQWMKQAEVNIQLAGKFAGGSNELFAQRYAATRANDALTQSAINAIKPENLPVTRESVDSPYWKKFWLSAIEQEKLHPWYMNDRNTVIASSVTLNNENIKFMTKEERDVAITNDIIDKQEFWIDPSIKSRYDNTVKNINWIVTRQLPEIKANDYFNMMVLWQDTSGASKENPYLQAGKRRFDELNSYVNMWNDWITNAVKSKTLLPGSTAWNDLVTKGFGAVLTQAQATISSSWDTLSGLISGVLWFDVNTSLSSQWTTALTFDWLEWQISLKLIQDMLDPKITTFSQFLLNDTWVQTARSQANATQASINTLNQQVSDLGDSMKEMFVSGGGTNENAPFMTAYITEKAKPMIRKLDMLQAQYANQAANLSNLSENARTDFESQQYKRDNKIKAYELILNMITTQKANKAATQQQAFENQIKLATLNKPIAVGKWSRLVDPVTGKVIIGASSSGSGGWTSSWSKYGDFASLLSSAIKSKVLNTDNTDKSKYTVNDQATWKQLVTDFYNTHPSQENIDSINAISAGLGSTINSARAKANADKKAEASNAEWTAKINKITALIKKATTAADKQAIADQYNLYGLIESYGMAKGWYAKRLFDSLWVKR